MKLRYSGMIHPFSDGNGRLARALQTLVLAGDGLMDPVFSSIEEWLGDNIQGYYDVLAEVGQGKWNPANDALPWVRFCLKAHYQQAAKVLRRVQEADGLYNKILQLIEQHKLNERFWFPMFDAALGIRVTNSRYRRDTDVTDITASRDLKRLCELDLLIPHGERKMRTYSAAQPLTDAWNAVRVKRAIDDPYELIKGRVRHARIEEEKESPRLPGF